MNDFATSYFLFFCSFVCSLFSMCCALCTHTTKKNELCRFVFQRMACAGRTVPVITTETARRCSSQASKRTNRSNVRITIFLLFCPRFSSVTFFFVQNENVFKFFLLWYRRIFTAKLWLVGRLRLRVRNPSIKDRWVRLVGCEEDVETWPSALGSGLYSYRQCTRHCNLSLSLFSFLDKNSVISLIWRYQTQKGEKNARFSLCDL